MIVRAAQAAGTASAEMFRGCVSSHLQLVLSWLPGRGWAWLSVAAVQLFLALDILWPIGGKDAKAELYLKDASTTSATLTLHLCAIKFWDPCGSSVPASKSVSSAQAFDDIAGGCWRSRCLPTNAQDCCGLLARQHETASTTIKQSCAFGATRQPRCIGSRLQPKFLFLQSQCHEARLLLVFCYCILVHLLFVLYDCYRHWTPHPYAPADSLWITKGAIQCNPQAVSPCMGVMPVCSVQHCAL